MREKIVVNGRPDIARAGELVGRAMPGAEGQACVLLCETMLVHMLESGMKDIGVTVRGRRYVDIRTAGEEIEFVIPAGVSEDERVELEIGLSLLEGHKNQVDLWYQKGVNRCRIYAVPRRDQDLSREIQEFYDNAGDEKSQRPLAVLFHLVSRHKARFALSMFFMAIKHVGAVMLPVFASGIIDEVVNNHVFFTRTMLLNVVGSAIALTVNLMGFWADTKVYKSFTRAIESGLKLALARKIEMLSMKYHDRNQSGRLLTKLISDAQFVEMMIYDRLREVLHLCIDVLFVLGVALLRFPPMVFFYALIVPATMLLIRSFSRPVMARKTFMRRQQETSNAAFKEMLEMDQLTRASGLQYEALKKVAAKVYRVQEAARDFDAVNVHVNNVTYGGFQGFRLLCLCFAAYLLYRGHISVGTVVLFQSLFDTLINSTQKVLDALPQITQGYDGLVSINEILYERDVEVNGTLKLPRPVRGEIALDHITFAYDDDAEPVLRDVSLRIPAGTTVAFAGKSGAGKSTLLNLILGLYTPTGGGITIDGMALDQLDKNDYRHHVAVVPQHTVLFSGTLWDNLVYGLSYVSRSQVMEVLRSVGLEEMVRRLPDGLDTFIYEDGGNLSGGQRQRIAIARALLRNARIILFDEATSALDALSEQQVQQAIDIMAKDATVVMVAHRLNTLKKADQIYRIEAGSALPVASFEALMRESQSEMGEETR